VPPVVPTGSMGVLMSETPTIEDRALPVSFDRPFFINRFVATHKSLLLRSPMGDSFDDRIDILFKGVNALKIGSRMQTLTVRHATPAETASVAADCGSETLERGDTRIFMLDGGHSSGYVVALSMFSSRDQRHGSNPSPLLFDEYGLAPAPVEVFHRFV
jgi:hypothetical protein